MNVTVSNQDLSSVTYSAVAEKVTAGTIVGMDKEMIDIMKKVKERMTELGLTQEQLAKEMGLTRSQITHYLSGRRNPPAAQLFKLAKILNFDLNELVSDLPSSKHAQGENDFPYTKECPILKPEEVEGWLKKPVLTKHHETIIAPYPLGPLAFVMKIVGDAMINEQDPDRGAFPGNYAIVEPAIAPTPGNLVLVEYSPNDIRIREYQEDGANKLLRAYAIKERTILTPAMKIIGSIVMTYKKRF